MQIPAFVTARPVETLLAGALLLALLFGGADRHAADLAQGSDLPHVAKKF